MDFSTIKSKMEAKDGTGYRNVREIYADVSLRSNGWLLPKVAEEGRRQSQEEAEAELDMQLAQAANYANMAKDLSFELDEILVSSHCLHAAFERMKRSFFQLMNDELVIVLVSLMVSIPVMFLGLFISGI
ncbi:hypothetical protein L6164_017045 [Bauhinia variegata]|uniref:Uncharacterized protein n=1 Tax=Bauhinia variegata TaxID=167791 RepID=A0ACB9N8I9_BAUVA|nr:hypothetical protein L6164_017045 [Bauhinia variegata]